jgi:Kef-type K+ transport system membrane component KefB
VFGAAVVDDVVVLAALPIALGTGGRGGVVTGVAGAVAFVVLAAAIGTPFFRHYAGVLDAPRVRRSPFVLGLALCLGLAAAAEQVGLAALVGAFLAGMVLAETREQFDLDRRMEPLFDFLVPFFFVIAGARMDPGALGGAGAGLLASLIVVTVLAKFLGCAIGAFELPEPRERHVVGSGMIPRGEVTLAVGTSGLAAGVVPPPVFAALVAVVLVSSVLGPAAVQASLPHRRPFARRRAGGPPEAGRGPDPAG